MAQRSDPKRTRLPSDGPTRGRAQHARFVEKVELGASVYYVRQVRSGIGEKPKTRGALRALGLGDIGDSNLQPDSPDALGSMHKARHLIEAQPLIWGTAESKAVASKFWPDAMVATFDELEHDEVATTDPLDGDDESAALEFDENREVGGIVTSEPYNREPKGGKGYRILTGDNLTVFVERYPSLASVTWPIRLPADRFLKAVEKLLGATTSDSSVIVRFRNRTEPVTVPLSTLSEVLEKEGDEVYIVRADASERSATVIWQRSFEDPGKFEGGIVARQGFPIDVLSRVLGETALGDISPSSDLIAAEAKALLS